MSDLISRQAALGAIKKLEKPAPTAQHLSAIFDCEDIIVALPSAQQWIPCSEWLPEGIGQAIVQTNGGAIHEVFYKGKNDYGHEVWMRLDGGIYWDDEVIAWIPFPAPYRPEGDDHHEG